MSDHPADKRVSAWLSKFGEALQRRNIEAASRLFGKESYWRDLVSFSWNIKTAEGRDAIAAMLEATLPSTKPTGFRLDGKASEADGVTEGWFTFETATAHGHGHIRLKGDECWTLLTAILSLKGHEEKAGATREKGVEHGVHTDRHTWLEERSREEAELGHKRQPFCLVVGGGQGGIGLGARLKRLGVPTLIIDKHERPGDAWRKRYKSLCLHDPVWYDHLPYLPFPEHWPVFSPKDKIGDWLEVLHQGHGARLLVVDRVQERDLRCEAPRMGRQGQAPRQTITLRPKHLVLATGMSGFRQDAAIPGHAQVQGRAAPFEPAPGRRRLGGQEMRRRSARTTPRTTSRRSLRARRRCDDGAALARLCGALRHADGARPRRALFRAGGQVRASPPTRPT